MKKIASALAALFLVYSHNLNCGNEIIEKTKENPKLESRYDNNLPIKDEKLFFYELEDYTNKSVKPEDINKKYLDKYKGTTVLYLWTPSCGYICANEFPEYNRISREHNGRVNFLRVLVKGKIDDYLERTDYSLERCEDDQKFAKAREKDLEDVMKKFVKEGFKGFGGFEKYNNIQTQAFNANFKAQGESIRNCNEFQQDREPLGLTIKTMDDRSERLEFPTLVLDNYDTRNYLMESENLPQVIILKDGRVIKRLRKLEKKYL